MSFKISDNQIWKKKMEKSLKIEFNSKPVYGDDEKYIKTKIKTYGVITNFHNKKCQKKTRHARVYQ